MKNVAQIFTMAIVLVFIACQKEELPRQQENAVSHKKSIPLLSGLSTKKPLKAHLVAKETPFKARSGHASEVFDDKIWVIGGWGHNDVWSSNNGSEWSVSGEIEKFEGRGQHASTVTPEGLWVVGGLSSTGISFLNDVWKSSDGKTWEQITQTAEFAPRDRHTLAYFNGSLWIIGGRTTSNNENETGLHSDIWRSFDGSTWFQVTDNAVFGPRRGHATVVHDGKLWVIGGLAGVGLGPGVSFKNDAWYSEDGYSWIQATNAAAFPGREGHSIVTDGERMWLIGGLNVENGGLVIYDDIWCSSNGVNWLEVDTTQNFPKRFNHSSVFFDDKVWAIHGAFGPLSDIWSFN